MSIPNRLPPQWDHEPSLAEMEEANPADYRAIAVRFLWLINHILDRMPSSVERWAVAFAIGHPSCNGRSMSCVAAELRVSKATISTAARKFLADTGLPPSSYMRKEETAKANRQSRLAFVRGRKPKTNKGRKK